MTARRFANMVIHWMCEHTDGEVWVEKFVPIFFPDPDTPEPQVSKAQLAPATPGQEGSLNIQRKADPVKVTDLSQFIGRAGSAGKADPNKAAIQEVARKRSGPAITIGPDPDGNLSVTTPDTP